MLAITFEWVVSPEENRISVSPSLTARCAPTPYSRFASVVICLDSFANSAVFVQYFLVWSLLIISLYVWILYFTIKLILLKYE